MRHPLLAKTLAVTATVLLLWLALARIGFLVDERQSHQAQAVQSVQQSHAGAQTLLGPLLQRVCSETWSVVTGSGADRRRETQRRDFTLLAVPDRLDVDTTTQADARYRGLFKVNGYHARLVFQAQWADLAALQPQATQPQSDLVCSPVTAWVATTDVRGLRGARLVLNGVALSVRPGTGNEAFAQGLQAGLPTASVPTTPLSLVAEIDLVGTAALALVPAAQTTAWTLRSDWPHPSFGGRFLPAQREIGDAGFSARWAVSSLATAVPQDLVNPGGRKLALAGLDTLAVDFIDPVNPYTLSDRAIKYGMLFVALSFASVALAELLARGRVRRVHPVQYALVGLTLCLFFLLLLSLSEHLAFANAYAVAAAACVLLLGHYARHMLGSVRDGWLFGAGMALLYALLYLLLLREQTALVLGSVGLFAALAAVMLLTRRVDWYRLTPANAA
ncbi:MAG TPA: cell envelope integrity protein CreD [Rubrivivax sp.]|nr:cell envelope integrity protein CreD [Rubrivivax sp.]